MPSVVMLSVVAPYFFIKQLISIDNNWKARQEFHPEKKLFETCEWVERENSKYATTGF